MRNRVQQAIPHRDCHRVRVKAENYFTSKTLQPWPSRNAMGGDNGVEHGRNHEVVNRFSALSRTGPCGR